MWAIILTLTFRWAFRRNVKRDAFRARGDSIPLRPRRALRNGRSPHNGKVMMGIGHHARHCKTNINSNNYKNRTIHVQRKNTSIPVDQNLNLWVPRFVPCVVQKDELVLRNHKMHHTIVFLGVTKTLIYTNKYRRILSTKKIVSFLPSTIHLKQFSEGI